MKTLFRLLVAVVLVLSIGRQATAQPQVPLASLISTVPTNGTNGIQTITIGGSPTTGGFTPKWNGLVGSAVVWSGTNSTLLSRLQTSLNSIFGSNNTVATAGTLSSGVGTILVTFQGSYAKEPISVVMTFVSNTMDGSGTISAATSTAGVLASYRQASPGACLIYTGSAPPITYSNTSTTRFSPTWSVLRTDTTTVLAADSATTGQTLIGSPLQFTGGVSQTWQFSIYLLASSSTAAGVEVGLTIPTGATLVGLTTGTTTGVTAFSSDVITASATATAAYVTLNGSGQIRINGTVIIDATHPGAVMLDFLKVTSGTATLKAGSYMTSRRVS